MTFFARVLAATTIVLLAGPGAAQDAIKPSHLEVARQVVVSSGISRSFDSLLPGFVQQVRRVTVTRPDLNKDLEEVITKVVPEFEPRKQELVEAAARLYAGKLSEPELTAVAAFYNSPQGKKYVEVQPVVIGDMYAELETWSQKTSGAMVERIRAEMRSRGKQF